jgi:hypothetical protein
VLQLLHQPALAHASLALNQHQAAAPLLHQVDAARLDSGKLGFPACTVTATTLLGLR